jgi:hypothetical protein
VSLVWPGAHRCTAPGCGHPRGLHAEPLVQDGRCSVVDPATTEGRYHAGLWVSDSFFDSPAEEQRQTVVHELLHVAGREQNDVIRAGGLPHVLGQDAYRVVWENYKGAHERQTDHLASLIAPHAPLPRIPRR